MGIILRTDYKDHKIELFKEYDDIDWSINIPQISSIRWRKSAEKTPGEALDKAIKLIELFCDKDWVWNE